MKAAELYDAVEAHPDLVGESIVQTDKGLAVLIRHKPTGLGTQFPIEAIVNVEWELLEKVLTGEREPDVLYHISRVVGYFSRTENWNASKLGELKDRHKGSYAIPEA